MTDEELQQYQDAEKLRERRRRRMEYRRKKRRQKRIMTLLLLIIILVVVIIAAIIFTKSRNNDSAKENNKKTESTVETEISSNDENTENAISGDITDEGEDAPASTKQYVYSATDSTKTIDTSEVISEYALLINADDMTIVAQKNADTRINPASMTKILTVLVAAEHITEEQLSDYVEITIETTDFAYKNDLSAVCYSVGEKVSVEELFYGVILPSGADAAISLAEYVAGSHEAFVEMMNEKLVELGISDTAHFTNCVGMYNENHYCTIKDMAVIINAAMDNEFVRQVMSQRKYTTASTPEHPDGIEISNWFLRRIEDKETGGYVVGAKTGYVNESGSCAASYYTRDDGVNFICVTGKSTSSWRCIYDHVAIYNIFAAGNTSYHKEGTD